jgi:hypothetical protein
MARIFISYATPDRVIGLRGIELVLSGVGIRRAGVSAYTGSTDLNGSFGLRNTTLLCS